MNLRGVLLAALFAAVAAVGLILLFFVATDNAGASSDPVTSPGRVEAATAGVCTEKAFVCKYVGTPYVDERLQTGQNPINVSVNAISKYQDPVVVGSYFNDEQGRSYVLACAYPGQRPEPSVSECPSPATPTPTPPLTPTPPPDCPECIPTPTPTPCIGCVPTPPTVGPTPTDGSAPIPAGGSAPTTTSAGAPAPVGTGTVQAPVSFPDTGGAPACDDNSISPALLLLAIIISGGTGAYLRGGA